MTGLPAAAEHGLRRAITRGRRLVVLVGQKRRSELPFATIVRRKSIQHFTIGLSQTESECASKLIKKSAPLLDEIKATRSVALPKSAAGRFRVAV